MFKSIVLLLIPFYSFSQAEILNHCYHQPTPCTNITAFISKYKLDTTIISEYKEIFVYSNDQHDELQLHYMINYPGNNRSDKQYTLYQVAGKYSSLKEIYTSFFGRKYTSNDEDIWPASFNGKHFRVTLSKLSRPDYWLIRIL